MQRFIDVISNYPLGTNLALGPTITKEASHLSEASRVRKEKSDHCPLGLSGTTILPLRAAILKQCKGRWSGSYFFLRPKRDTASDQPFCNWAKAFWFVPDGDRALSHGGREVRSVSP